LRAEYTDTIKEFVEYATKQGSSHAKTYYANLTKMEYKALRFLEKSEKVPSNFRNILDSLQLSQLMLAELLAEETIREGMEDERHYKEIFLLAKQAVEKYADSIMSIIKRRLSYIPHSPERISHKP